MANDMHERYAGELLRALQENAAGRTTVRFEPDEKKRRNAAGAMTAIVQRRLTDANGELPTRVEDKTYRWNGGIFVSRNIADRKHFWTNIRRNLATESHRAAQFSPVVYLMACCRPREFSLYLWAIPEPLLYDCLSRLQPNQGGKVYSVQIDFQRQRIEKCTESPDLAPYFLTLQLSEDEFKLLEFCRETDANAKKASALEDDIEDEDNDDVESHIEHEIDAQLASAGRQLTQDGEFDPSTISDARERVFSAIVRRQGQPAFRQHLLSAYRRSCAITGCEVEAVLEAAHIVPYKGQQTNHPANGLLLRADIHTLFDLRLITIDPETMAVLVSSRLSGTEYEKLHGCAITQPNDEQCRPSRDALMEHCKARVR